MTREIPDEEAALADVADRLATRFPDAEPAHIEDAVHDAYHHFDGAKVRDFVPVLTEREARAQLEQEQ